MDIFTIKKEIILPHVTFACTPGESSESELSEDWDKMNKQSDIIQVFLEDDDMEMDDFIDLQVDAGLLDLGTDQYIEQVLDAVLFDFPELQ